MAQLYNESVLETTSDKDINASFVPDFEPSNEDPLNMPLQVANLPDEML